MSFDQHHEPPAELATETRTFTRMITSLERLERILPNPCDRSR